MKQFRFLAMAALIAFGTSVCAQNVITLDEMQARKQQQPQQQAVQQKASYSSASDNEGFGTLFLQYNPSQIHASYKGNSSNSSVNAFTLGFTYALPLGGIPLYLEFGAAAQYFFKSEDIDYYDYDDYYGYSSSHEKAKFSMFSIKIPVNVMYSFDVSDAVSIIPYAGLYGRVNVLAQTKVGDEKANHFSKDDMGDDTWKRFQLGANLGCKARFAKKFAVGIGYYMDITKITDYTTFRGWDITLGFTF